MTKIDDRLARHGQDISDLRQAVRDLVVAIGNLREQILLLGPVAERSEESA